MEGDIRQVARDFGDGVVCLRLSGADFALDPDQTHFAVPLVQVRPLAGAPDLVYGVARLRGEVVPVIDVAARFGLPPLDLDAHRYLLVVGAPRKLALVCDTMPSFLAARKAVASAEELLPPGLEHCARFVDGAVLLEDERLVPHLDLERLLDPDELRALDQALEPQ